MIRFAGLLGGVAGLDMVRVDPTLLYGLNRSLEYCGYVWKGDAGRVTEV